MVLDKCPDPNLIKDFLSGNLDEQKIARLEGHLNTCDHCSNMADTLISADDFTAITTQHSSSNPIRDEDDSIVRRVIERAKLMRSASETALTDATSIYNPATRDGSQAPDGYLNPQSGEGELLPMLSPPEQPDEIGRLGGYRIFEVLGVGGMGVVYRAEDPMLKRRVAIKAMKPAVAQGRDARERFLREAEATAAIEHDNIVTIYQVGEDRRIPFIAMQFLRGESLETRIQREGALGVAESVRIGREVAEGLQAAHACGLIHRDVKPDNVWLQEGQDRVRIVDFGLARNFAEDSGLTIAGTVLGTPRYMAPEQASGQEVDHRCDLFSLGCVLYRIYTGHNPFHGTNITAVLLAVTNRNPTPIRELVPDADCEVCQLIDDLLQKDRDNRPASAREVADRLSAIQRRLASAPVVSQPEIASGATDIKPAIAVAGFSPPTRRGNRVFLGLGGIFAAALLAGLILKFRTTDGTIIVELQGEMDVAQVEVDGRSIAFSPDGSSSRIRFTVDPGSHVLTMRSSDGVELDTSIGEQAIEIKAGETTTLKAFLQRSGADRPSIGGDNNQSSLAMNQPVKPDSIHAQSKPAIKNRWKVGREPLWATGVLQLLQSPTLPGIAERPTSFANARRWNVDTIWPRGEIGVVRYSPDSKWLAVGSFDGHVRIYDAYSLELHRLLPGLGGTSGVVDIAWTPTSDRLAIVTDDQKAFRIWSLDGKLINERVTNAPKAVLWHPNGKSLVLGGQELFELTDTAGSTQKMLADSVPLSVQTRGLAFNHDGTQIVAAHQDGTIRIWDTVTGKNKIIAENLYTRDGIAVSDTGWVAVIGDTKVKLIHSETGQKQEIDRHCRAVHWLPRSSQLLCWDGGRQLVWDCDSQQVIKTVEEGMTGTTSTHPSAISISPNGKWIATGAGELFVRGNDLESKWFDAPGGYFPISDVDVSSDGDQVITCCNVNTRHFSLLNAAGLSKTVRLEGESYLIWRLSLSPDGKFLAATNQISGLWIGPSSGPLKRIDSNPTLTVEWNHDGKYLLVVALPGKVSIRSQTGELLANLSASDGPKRAAWFPGQDRFLLHFGKTLASCESADGWIPKEIGTSAGEVIAVNSGSTPNFTPDGSEFVIDSDGWYKSDATPIKGRALPQSGHAFRPRSGGHLMNYGNRFLLNRADGAAPVLRGRNGASFYSINHWVSSGDRFYSGSDQSVLTAWDVADDIQPVWHSVSLPQGKVVTFTAAGDIVDGQRDDLDEFLVYFTDGADDEVVILSPQQFEQRIGETLIP